MEKLYQNRDWLWGHYIVGEESMHTMAQEAECGEETIRRWLYKYEIPIRNRGEGIFLAKRNSAIITPELLGFMRGEIMGDGHIGMTGNRSAYYAHGSKYREYVIWLSAHFDKWGIGQVGQINGCKDKRYGTITYHYASKSYPELVPIYQRWYSERDGKMKKTIPKDLELTSIMARQWYIGDGGFSDYKIKRPGIVFGTYDFDRQSVEYLIEELGRLGFKATRKPSDNTIRIWVQSVPDFLEWIGPSPISCYDYKWNY